MERDADVVVVGGGLAGLSAAAVAARAGAKVLVLEAREELGGRARTMDRDGFLLNEGAHALFLRGAGISVLRDLGIEPQGAPAPTKDAMAWVAGRLDRLPLGPSALARTHALGARGKLELAALLARLPHLDPASLRATPTAEWIERSLGDDGARHVLRALVRLGTYAVDPDLSAEVAVGQLQRGAAGVLYLDGGWRQLVDGLRAAAVAAGVEIRTGEKVERIDPATTDRDPVSVHTQRHTIRGGAVVVAAGGPAAPARLLPAPGDDVRAWAEDARPARAAALDVALRTPWGDHPLFVLGVDRPLYLSVHSHVARLAPEGGSLVSLMKYVPAHAPADADGDRRELEALLDATRPGWREDAVDALFRSRLVVATDVPRAAAGGLAGRPGPHVPGAPGVLVAGDWVGPTGLLADAALASGATAGRLAAIAARSPIAA